MENLGLILLLISFAALLRITPILLSPAGAGIDHWFWKKYIETSRQTKEFPPSLPQYILDQHQWYPPLFPLCMLKVPIKLFERWNSLLAIIVDLVRMALLLSVASWFTNGDLVVTTASGLIYATTPIQISYNFQLNPRGLGALFLDLLLITLLWFYSYHGPISAWVLILFLSGLILLTHKMTTQLFWFICLCCSVLFQDLCLLLLIPASIATATIMSKGFYLKVLVAHWDIVRFWQRHWRWIGADIIRESPLYGEEDYQRPQKLHQTGIKGILWHCFVLFGFNPASWITCLLLFERLFVTPHVLVYSTWLMAWLLIPCLLAVLTTFIPVCRCIGAGYLYLYNSAFITSLLLGLAFRYSKAPTLSYLIYSLALSLNLLGVMLFYRKFLKNNRSRIEPGFHRILEKLKVLPHGTVWCIPSGWHEPVAYKTSHAVLWGAHGYGFKLLEPTFPRLLMPIKDVLQQYHVKYLLTTEEQLTERLLDDLPNDTKIVKEDNYALYIFNG